MYGAAPFPPHEPAEPGGARPWTPPVMPDDAVLRALRLLQRPDPLEVIRKVVQGLLASHPDARGVIEACLKEAP